MYRWLAVFLAIVSLFAATVTPAVSPFHLRDRTSGEYFLNLNTVGMIVCADFPDGVTIDTPPESLTIMQRMQTRFSSGTGTIIARNRVLTAAHVVRGFDVCVFKDKVLRTVYQDARVDTAVLVADLGDTPVTPVNCDGLTTGEYLGFGFAGGKDFAVQRFTFGGDYTDSRLRDGTTAFHQALVGGEAHAGMSGGPVVNGAGEVVAIINTGGPRVGGLRDLTDTPLCAALTWSATP